MSKFAQVESTEENLLDSFKSCMDLADWAGARRVIIQTTKDEFYGPAAELQEIYRAEVCGDCRGVGEVTDGEHDNLEVKKCVCQL